MPLFEELMHGNAQIISSKNCLAEWKRVLRYEKLKLDLADIINAEEEFLNYTCVKENPPCEAIKHYPQCRDKDDQKFIDAAIYYQCHWLISRDKHVLKLKNRMQNYNVVVSTPILVTFY